MKIRKKQVRAYAGKMTALLLLAAVLLALPLAGVAGNLIPGAGLKVQAAQFAETIRVGIYYGKDNVNTVSLRSDTGITLSAAAADGTVTQVWDQPDAQMCYVRKDAWYVKSADGRTQEYVPSVGMPYEGEVAGPHHLRIGNRQPDFATASNVSLILRNSGVRAYPAYEDGWYVWTGFFIDSNAANAGKLVVADLIGSADITVVPATPNRLTVLDANLDTVCLYGGVNGSLAAVAKNGGDLMAANGKRYRGAMEFRRYADSDLTMINILGIEPYLYGVVPSEIEALAPTEAIMAQAVAARTYAMKNIGKYKKWGFDLSDTIESQVYNGYEGERVQSNLAVDATKGLKALYNGELASLFYFSSSGGMTEDNLNVWGYDLPYLKSVPDPYESKTSYNYYWQKVLTPSDVERYLAAAQADVGSVLSVSTMEFSTSGRVIKLRITGTKGSVTYQRDFCRTLFEFPSQMYTLGGTETMAVLGADGGTTDVNPKGLYVQSADGVSTVAADGSTIVAVGLDEGRAYAGTASGNFVFTGLGWGHGIGMSQEGAKGFARNGYTFTQILQHYFPGITIQ
jgi:stage II sporulation protein D